MKNVTEFVNTGIEDAITKIKGVKDKYNASWVGQFCGKNRYGDWVEGTMDVYWQPTPPQGYSNYMGLLIQQGSLYITSGATAVTGVIAGVVANDGEIIYSRHRHDYRTSRDGSVWIDGGRDYVRTGTNRTVQLVIIDGQWLQLEDGDVAP